MFVGVTTSNWFAVWRAQNHSGLTHQKAIKLPVLFRPYLLKVMYMTFQYLTVSCIPTIGRVPNNSRYDSWHLLIVTNILWHKVLDIDCNWHKFLVANCLWLGLVSDSEAFISKVDFSCLHNYVVIKFPTYYVVIKFLKFLT